MNASVLEVGRALWRRGYVRTGCIDRYGVRPNPNGGDPIPYEIHAFGDFNPEAYTFAERYGIAESVPQGFFFGEAYVHEIACLVIGHASNPLGLQAPFALDPNGGKDVDLYLTLCMATRGGPVSAYQELILPAARALGFLDPPPPVEPPPPPGPVEPPPPVVPPPGMSAPEVRAEELAILVAPVYDLVRNRSFFTRRLPSWAELWPVAKPLAIELVKAVRRTAGRVR